MRTGSAFSENFGHMCRWCETRLFCDRVFHLAELLVVKFVDAATGRTVKEGVTPFFPRHGTEDVLTIAGVTMHEVHIFQGFDDPVDAYGIDRVPFPDYPFLNVVGRDRLFHPREGVDDEATWLRVAQSVRFK